jgi:hypothetical protein
MIEFSKSRRHQAVALLLLVVATWMMLDCLGNQFSYTTQGELCQKAVTRLGEACDSTARMILENCTKRLPSVSRAIWIEGLCGTGILVLAIRLLLNRRS